MKVVKEAVETLALRMCVCVCVLGYGSTVWALKAAAMHLHSLHVVVDVELAG